MTHSSCLVIPIGAAGDWNADDINGTLAFARERGVYTICVLDGFAGSYVPTLEADETHEVELSNSYAARNVGVQAAMARQAREILFLDSDCTVGRNWPDHILEHLSSADIVSVLAPPLGVSRVGRINRTIYTERFETWHSFDGSCGAEVNSFDTRASGVRAAVFGRLLFEEKLRHAGDAYFGRQALKLGLSVVGCNGGSVMHADPKGYTAELRKAYHTARRAAEDVAKLPRKDLVTYLPEYAHLRLQPSLRGMATQAFGLLMQDASMAVRREPGWSVRVYADMLRICWSLGWWARCH